MPVLPALTGRAGKAELSGIGNTLSLGLGALSGRVKSRSSRSMIRAQAYGAGAPMVAAGVGLVLRQRGAGRSGMRAPQLWTESSGTLQPSPRYEGNYTVGSVTPEGKPCDRGIPVALDQDRSAGADSATCCRRHPQERATQSPHRDPAPAARREPAGHRRRRGGRRGRRVVAVVVSSVSTALASAATHGAEQEQRLYSSEREVRCWRS
jgi:hypothetical protein